MKLLASLVLIGCLAIAGCSTPKQGGSIGEKARHQTDNNYPKF